MTTDEFVSLLTDAENTYSIVKHEKRIAVHFRDRGYEFIGIPYDDDPEFLHIKTIFPAPEVLPSADNVRSILLQLKEEYRIIKLRCFDSHDGKSQIEVGAEQFEANSASARGIFFRTLDLLVDSARECLRRLNAHPKTGTIAEMPDRVLEIEKLLRAACLEAMNQKYNGVDTKIRSSLALAMNSSGTGTAFCVASSADRSIYITNAHVVEEDKTISLDRQWPEFTKMLGTVDAKGDVEKTDPAIVSVAVGNVPAVLMSAGSPAIDVTVSLAGYPRVQKFAADSFGEFYPAFHRGTITAIARHGAVVMYDALSRPGNSGGPLNDPVDGKVYGVEAADWESDEESITISTVAVITFLKKHDIAI